MPVAPTPTSREEIPEAQSLSTREIDAEVGAEVRLETSQSISDFVEWPDKHVPFERVGKGHGRRGGEDDHPTGSAR
jgi:hypothetical protein